MRLRSLRVRNIRSYEVGSLDFGAGTTLIAGDVGAGKTSLLYAIEMALFGTSEVDPAFLVRHGAPHAEVAVGFEDAEHRYEISRKFRRVRRKGRETFEPEAISFSVDGAKTEYSATELRQRVIELLGFPDNPNPTAHSDLWRWAVYVPQERMRDILSAKPQDRLETVRKALGVEKYRTAAENAQELATDLRRSAHGRRAEADLLRHFDEEFATATLDADRLRVERSALEDTLARREEAVGEARTKLEVADTAVRRTEADGRELSSLLREDDADEATLRLRSAARAERTRAIELRRAEADSATGEAQALELLRRELAAVESDRARQRHELDALAGDLHELHRARADLASAERRVGPAEEEAARSAAGQRDARAALERAVRDRPEHEPPMPTPETLETLDAKLAGLRERETAALTARTRSQASLHEFEELLHAGVCPRCGQSVRPADFEPHRAEASTQSEEAEAAYGRARAERSHAEEERRARERFERAHQRWLEVERERARACNALEQADANARRAAAALSESARAVADARSRMQRWAPTEARESALRVGIATTESDHSRLAERVELAVLASDRMRAAAAAAAGLEAEVARIDLETAALRERSAERARHIDSLRALVAGAEAQLRRFREAETELRGREEALQVDRRALVRVDTRLDESVRRVSEAERGRSERARRVSEASDLEAKAAWVTGPFRRAVLTMEQKILAHAQTAFERNFARYFAALIDDPALLAQTDVAFTPGVAIEGEWTPAEALSGGERTSLALAFRLALAQVVRSLGNLRLETILLDEPTDGFSPEQVVRMGELLEALALPQVILVSHEDELASVADRVVRVEKTDGASVLNTGVPAPEPAPASGNGS